MSFQRAVAFVFAREGADLVQDPHDPGGLSRYGIALKRHPNLTADDIRNMTPTRAAAIYGTDYWIPIHGDQLPQHLHVPMLDCAVNQGPATAIRCLQRTLCLTADGIMGPRTLAAAGAADPHTTLAGLATERIAEYSADSGWVAFGRGWTRRAVLASLEA